MKKIILLVLMTICISNLSWATLTPNNIPVTNTGGTSPSLKNSDITDNVGVAITVSNGVPVTATTITGTTITASSRLNVTDIEGAPITINTITPADMYTSAWSDYSGTSTTAGWSVFTTKNIYVKQIGKTVYVSYNLQGTSNGQSATFSLPYINAAASDLYSIAHVNNNGGAFVVSPASLPSVSNVSNNIVIVSPTANFGNWTSSGVKTVRGELFYQAQ